MSTRHHYNCEGFCGGEWFALRNRFYRRGVAMLLSDLAILNPSRLEELQDLAGAVGDEFLKELVDTFERDVDRTLSALKKAQETNDASAMAFTAHSFKSSCANLGGDRLANLCQRIESKARAGDLRETASLLALVEQELPLFRQALRAALA